MREWSLYGYWNPFFDLDQQWHLSTANRVHCSRDREWGVLSEVRQSKRMRHHQNDLVILKYGSPLVPDYSLPVTCRMFNSAIRGQRWLPKYLSSDNDPLYQFHKWQANLRILELTEIKTIPYVPLSHPFVERLIGTLRREYSDKTLFWTTADLENKLLDFRTYFNDHRTHRALKGRTPAMPVSGPAANLRSFDGNRTVEPSIRHQWQRNL